MRFFIERDLSSLDKLVDLEYRLALVDGSGREAFELIIKTQETRLRKLNFSVRIKGQDGEDELG